MSLYNKLKSKIYGLKEGNKDINQNDIEKMILGETLLTTKMLMWDSDKFPFIRKNWDEYGFKVFSQNNEDGLIQYIINHTDLPQKNFVEFGVEDYSECNTRFLCIHNNWSGLVMDGSEENMLNLRKQDIYWKRTIESKGVFITKENINGLIEESGFFGNIGLLSVDIDGNDYWVFDAIKCIEPRILICEYNPIYGPIETVSIPYKPDFYRTDAHYSNLYSGASLRAWVNIANNKGYKLVCINNLGQNAFFVKREASNLPEVTIEEAWREPVYRESRDENGNLSFLSMEEGRKLLKDMPIVDVVTGEKKLIGDIVVR